MYMRLTTTLWKQPTLWITQVFSTDGLINSDVLSTWWQLASNKKPLAYARSWATPKSQYWVGVRQKRTHAVLPICGKLDNANSSIVTESTFVVTWSVKITKGHEKNFRGDRHIRHFHCGQNFTGIYTCQHHQTVHWKYIQFIDCQESAIFQMLSLCSSEPLASSLAFPK